MAQRCAPHALRLCAGLLVSLGQSALAIPAAVLLKRAFDQSIPKQDISELWSIGLALLALRVVSTAATIATKAISLKVTRQTLATLRRELQDKVLDLPRSFYQRVGSDKVQDVLVMETDRFEQCLGALLGSVVPSVVLAAALAAILVYLDARLFLLMLLVWPTTWIMNEVVRRRAIASVRVHNTEYRSYARHFRWFVDALDFVRVHNAEAREEAAGDAHIDTVQRTGTPVQLLNTVYVQTQLLLLTVISVVILLAGGNAVAQGRMSLGELLSFYTVVGLLNTALREFAQGMYWVLVGTESLKEILNLLHSPETLPYKGKGRLELRDELALCDVAFAYAAAEPVLRDASLKLRPDSVVALVGANGTGKSTILSLLLGFYRPNSGHVSADGRPYDELDLGHLRSQMGVVTQDPLLFAASIEDNVSYGCTSPPSAPEVWAALRLAAMEEWVRALPEGLQTPVGDRGTRLSGGQRQRLAIARALMGAPRFLILDEPTNHLDAQAIAEIMANLQKLPSAPGILIITHDRGVAAQADEMWELQAGGLRLVSHASVGSVS